MIRDPVTPNASQPRNDLASLSPKELRARLKDAIERFPGCPPTPFLDEVERRAERAAELCAAIEEAHNGYQETGRANGWRRPESHLIALRELLTEQSTLSLYAMKDERADASRIVAKLTDELIAAAGNLSRAFSEERAQRVADALAALRAVRRVAGEEER